MILLIAFHVSLTSALCTPLLNMSLPGTHDSGAYYLTENIQPYYDNQPEILYELIRFSEKMGLNISKIITPWAKSQDRNVSTQLRDGMQYIDFRCGWNGTHWNTYHFEIGITCQEMLNQIKSVIGDNPNKIYIIEVSHLDGSQLKSYNILKLAHQINKTLHEYLYPRKEDLYFSDCDVFKEGKNTILTLGEYLPEYPLIWYQPDVIINTYANTPYLQDMIAYNTAIIQRFNKFKWDRLFKMSWTLTPNVDFIIENLATNQFHGLIQLADTANKEALNDFNKWIIQNRLKWPNINIIDHYETSKLIHFV